VLSGERGLGLDLGDGVRLEVLYPGAKIEEGGGFGHNNASVVVRLTYGITGRADRPLEVERVPEGELL
jgi:hypothetical protein